MQGTILIFAFVAVGSGILAVLAFLVYSFLTGSNPSKDPPRAFIAGFFGFWIASFFLVSSFLVDDSIVAWILRILAFFCAVAALYVRSTFILAVAAPPPSRLEQAATIEMSPMQAATDQPIVQSESSDVHSEFPPSTTDSV